VCGNVHGNFVKIVIGEPLDKKFFNLLCGLHQVSVRDLVPFFVQDIYVRLIWHLTLHLPKVVLWAWASNPPPFSKPALLPFQQSNHASSSIGQRNLGYPTTQAAPHHP
jgi:hypothetical protein